MRALPVREGEVELDGRLSEDVWQLAGVATGFIQRDPEDGSPATERTEARVVYSSSAIYVGIRAFDSQPDEIRSELVRRDGGPQSDVLGFFLDSYHDRRTAFAFTVTPSGSIRDIYYYNDGWADASWDAVWQVETSVDSLGWTAEFRIPLTQLRFDNEKTTWGFQVYRRIHRNAEVDYWSPVSKEASGYVSLFGELEGLENLSQPMRLELRPYTVVNNRQRPGSEGILYAPGSETQFNAGLDLQYGLTSDFTLDLTVNPDFGQVEADPAVVNLTAFETYFPEKRPFFIEGSGLFDRYVPAGQLFYSRRIGRPPQGFATPPDGGTVEIPDASTIISAAKVTGKTAGGLGLGLLSAVTAREKATLRDSLGTEAGKQDVAPLTHHLAGRIEQDFREGSHTVGAMVTALNRKLDENLDFLRSAAYAVELDGTHRWKDNTWGVYWNLAASYIRGSRSTITSAQRSSFRYYQRPDAPHVELDTTRTSLSGYALSVGAGKEAGTWQYGAEYSWVTPGFDISDMGFQWFADLQGLYAWGNYLQARPRWIFRDFRFMANAGSEWTTGGERLSSWLLPFYFYGRLRNNWSVYLFPARWGWDHLSVTALRGGPAVRGDASWRSYLEVATDARKPISLSVWANKSRWIGTSREWLALGPNVRFRPTPLLNGSLGLFYRWERNPTQWVTRRSVADSTHYVLAEIEQKTLSLTLRLDWTLTPSLSIQFYGEPFAFSGRYSDFKGVAEPRAREFADRYRLYHEELTCGSDGVCEVDLDLDGAADFTFSHPDFSSRYLRSTMVVRWEYRPGSVLFLAWQHGRSSFTSDAAFGAFDDLADLFDEPADNTFLVKANYWLSF